MRQWILLGLLSGLVACQAPPSTPTPAQPLLKSVGYIVYVNQGPPERLAWEFPSQKVLDQYYAQAAQRLKQRSGSADAKQAARQGMYYFLAVAELGANPQEPPFMGQTSGKPGELTGEQFNDLLGKKCTGVKRLEGMYVRDAYPNASPYSSADWLAYQSLAANYSIAWNDTMMRACIEKYL
ncbi:hypothetical protein [uncultured Thiothrix sp.]|uniref:hypothetical protein n=1 Tax=uncultured Thiothrix sp. TaxID=223185 RepID=UPI00260C30F3|nr:hypothetical protein [uncultured Thiothrix sp.]